MANGSFRISIVFGRFLIHFNLVIFERSTRCFTEGQGVIQRFLRWLLVVDRVEGEKNTTANSFPSISKPSTTSSSTPISLDDDKSPNQTKAADSTILLLTTRHTSSTWTHFTRKRVGEEVKAECNYCNKQLAGGPRAGTSHLTEHTKKCVKKKCLDIR
ncbi:hypothetical protein V6N13_125917 [Hibiscus sabdariffa]